MTRLERLKNLNEKRTKGPWFDVADGSCCLAVATNDYKEHSSEGGFWICRGTHDELEDPSRPEEESENMRFIAEIANAADDLIAVVEAARHIYDHIDYCSTAATFGCDCGVGPLKEALKKLEAQP